MRYVVNIFNLSLAAILFAAFCGVTQAQEDATEVRALINALQEKLARLENADARDDRVTEIGRARIKARDPDALVVRIYDMSDLFSVAPSYRAQRSSDLKTGSEMLFPVSTQSAAGGFGGGGALLNVEDRPSSISGKRGTLHQFNESAGNLAESRTSIDELIEAIQSTISPTEWDEVGGVGSISQLGNALIISATTDTHDQIDALLKLFRKRWGSLRTVSIRANWTWLTDDELAKLLTAEADAEQPAFGVIDEVAWKELLAARKKKAEGGGPTDYSAVITCYNGQTVHTLSGGQRMIVTEMSPVVGSDQAIAYQPRTSLVQQGAALQVTPLTNTSGKLVILDIHSRVLEIEDGSKILEKVEKIDDSNPPIDKLVSAVTPPELQLHRLSTTLRVPVDQTMLIGGMTFTNAGAPAEQKLYLFVKISVQELRDDLTAEAVTPEEAPEASDNAEDAGEAEGGESNSDSE